RRRPGSIPGMGTGLRRCGEGMIATRSYHLSFVKNLLLRMFGRPKGVLGRLGGIIMARTNRNIAARAIELLDVRPADKVLDIGFGPGVGIQLLAGLVSSGRIVGIDDSAEMVEQAG